MRGTGPEGSAMRWIVIVSDLLLLIACLIAIWSYPLNPLVWLLVGAAYVAWQDSGGNFAWRRVR